MELFDLITEEDKDIMNYWIDSYAGKMPYRKKRDLKHVLRIWNDEKKLYLYKLLGNNIFYTFPIKYAKSNDRIKQEIEHAWYDADSKVYPFARFLEDISECFWIIKSNITAYDLASESDEALVTKIFMAKINCYTNESNAAVLSKYFSETKNIYINYFNEKDIDVDTGFSQLMRCFDRLKRIDAIVNNVYDGDTCYFYDNIKNKWIAISKGMKVFKILRKIANIFGMGNIYKEFMEQITAYSYVTELEADVILSIHPMDYMTMSDTNEWSSCMSWGGYGDYRRGTVEMMNSRMVVMAYIVSKHETLPIGNDYEWNDKMWRELFIVTPDLISGVKGYNFWDHDIEALVIAELRKLAEQNLDWRYSQEIKTYEPGVDMYFDELGECPYRVQFSTNAMYNDMQYDVHQCVMGLNAPEYQNIYYSGEGVCMCCGEFLDDDYEGNEDASSLLICPRCGGYERCDICGYWEPQDSLIYVDGIYVCDNCYDSAERCPICEKPMLNNSHEVVLYLAHEGKLFEYARLYLCEDCLENSPYWDKEAIHSYKHKNYYGSTIEYFYINVNDIKENGLECWGWGYTKEYVFNKLSYWQYIKINPENDILLFEK